MTTSGVYGFNPLISEIVSESFGLLQIGTQGETLSGAMLKDGINSLNFLLKHMQTAGIHLWTYSEGSMFMEIGKAIYDFGDSDTRVVNEFFQTSLAAAAAVNATTIIVDDFSNILVDDRIGIITSDNDLFWTTVTATPTTTSVIINPGLDLAANNAAVVYNYRAGTLTTSATVSGTVGNPAQFDYSGDVILTIGEEVELVNFSEATYAGTQTVATIGDGFFTTSLIFSAIDSGDFITTTEELIPVTRLTINGARRKDPEGYEIPILFKSLVDYTDLPDKGSQGQPIQAYYQRSLPFGKMFLWPAPANASSIINFTYERKLQKVIKATETLDVAEEYLEYIIYGLARRLMAKYGTSAENMGLIISESDRHYDSALAFDNAIYPIEMDMDYYGEPDY